MAQNAANIEQEAAEEEAMLAAMEEELPTDEELEAQLYGDGFVGFEDDDDDYDDDGYDDDGLDESEEDMTAEAMAESDAASAMADASNPPELDEPAVLTEQPAQQPEKPAPDSEESKQIDEQPDISEQYGDPQEAPRISDEDAGQIVTSAKELAEKIDLLMTRQEKLFNDQLLLKDQIDNILASQKKCSERMLDSAERIRKGDIALRTSLRKGTLAVLQDSQEHAEKAISELSAAVRDNINAIGEESTAHINALQIESTKRVQNMIKATRPQRFASCLKYGAAMTAFALVAMVVAKMILL